MDKSIVMIVYVLFTLHHLWYLVSLNIWNYTRLYILIINVNFLPIEIKIGCVDILQH
jgi:hypothetical protein